MERTTVQAGDAEKPPEEAGESLGPGSATEAAPSPIEEKVDDAVGVVRVTLPVAGVPPNVER